MKQGICLILCSVLLACGGGGSSTSAVKPPEQPQQPSQPALLQQRLAAWLPAQQDWLASLSCPAAGCNTVSVSLSSRRFEPQHQRPDQTIAVLDDGGMAYLAVLPYRQRIKSYWQVNASGRFAEADPMVTVPDFVPALYDRLRQFHQPGGGGFVPASWLAALQTQLNKLAPGFTSPFSGHGSVALRYLAEHNPQAELVVVQLPELLQLFSSEFCAGDVTALQQKVTAISQQFYQDVIIGQDVEWLNMSAGYDHRSLKAALQRCPQAPEPAKHAALLAALQPFYQMLFASPKLLGVQAGVVNNNPAQFPLDQPLLPHRIRAGFFNTGLSSSQLDANGVPQGALPAVPADQANSLDVLDVLVNFASDNREFPCQLPAYGYKLPSISGLAYGPLCDDQTSWAAPVVLSRLIQLRQSRFAEIAWSDALISQLKSALTPALCSYPAAGAAKTCKLQDPLLHRQHEVFRLQYLP